MLVFALIALLATAAIATVMWFAGQYYASRLVRRVDKRKLCDDIRGSAHVP